MSTNKILTKEQLTIPLRYHKDTAMFYDENGNLDEEPEQTLEELEKNFADDCATYKRWKEDYERVMAPYRDPKTGKIDYDAIENDDSEQGIKAFQYGLAEFNAFSALDEYQYYIDLKIMHLNHKNINNE